MTSHYVQALSRKTNTQQDSPFKLEQLGAQAKNMLCKIKHQNEQAEMILKSQHKLQNH